MSAPPDQERRRTAAADGDGRSLAVAGSVAFRAVNEQIYLIAERSPSLRRLQLHCECERENCFARLFVAPADYEAIRRFPTRFVIAPEHVSADERIVEETHGYVVVEKLGAAAQAAILRDPRRQTDHQSTR